MDICNADEMRVGKLAKTVTELTGSRSVLIREPLPVDDPRHRQPDLAVARRALGWELAVPLPVGLRRSSCCFERLSST